GNDAYEWKPERGLSSQPEVVRKVAIPGVLSHCNPTIGLALMSVSGDSMPTRRTEVVLSELLGNYACKPSDRPAF
ncbi:hypothetical protein BD311DRAFT_617347, partial [Dichomitus squalens]